MIRSYNFIWPTLLLTLLSNESNASMRFVGYEIWCNCLYLDVRGHDISAEVPSPIGVKFCTMVGLVELCRRRRPSFSPFGGNTVRGLQMRGQERASGEHFCILQFQLPISISFRDKDGVPKFNVGLPAPCRTPYAETFMCMCLKYLARSNSAPNLHRSIVPANAYQHTKFHLLARLVSGILRGVLK